MHQICTWLFGRGASIANGLTWVVPEEWKDDLAAGRISRGEHVEVITEALREEMDQPSVHSRSYRHLMDLFSTKMKDKIHHRLITTNWDYLLQREVERWIQHNTGGVAPRFLSTHGAVYHLNGTVEVGDFQNRSPFLLETDSSTLRIRTYEANQAFKFLQWSTLVVIVGMSFECDMDKGLLAALRASEDNLPIGLTHFFVVEPSAETLKETSKKLVTCFPRASVIQVRKGLEEWMCEEASELVNQIFMVE
jgi:hypothetical protein